MFWKAGICGTCAYVSVYTETKLLDCNGQVPRKRHQVKKQESYNPPGVSGIQI